MAPLPDLSEAFHVDTFGVRLSLLVAAFDEDTCRLEAIDVSLASTQEITLAKPDGTALLVTSTFDTDGSDGLIGHTFLAGELDQAGTWNAQGRVVLPGSVQYRTKIVTFPVASKIPTP